MSTAAKDRRIYEETAGGWAVPTDYVMDANRNRVREKFKGKPSMVRAESVEKQGCVLDCGHRKGTNMSAARSKGDYNQTIGIDANEEEVIELVINLAAAVDTDGEVNLGASVDGHVNITGGVAAESNVTVSGFADANSVEALGKLAYTGTVKIMKIHAQASDKSFYDNSIKATGYKANGDIAGQKTIQWEKIDKTAENTDARQNVFPGGLCLQGTQHLKVPVKKNTDVSLTIYATYTPNR